jgi:serine protease
VHLTWTGANSPREDIQRNGVRIARVQNAGSYTDVLTVQGLYRYQVCESGTRNCSNEVTVRFGP